MLTIDCEILHTCLLHMQQQSEAQFEKSFDQISNSFCPTSYVVNSGQTALDHIRSKETNQGKESSV